MAVGETRTITVRATELGPTRSINIINVRFDLDVALVPRAAPK